MPKRKVPRTPPIKVVPRYASRAGIVGEDTDMVEEKRRPARVASKWQLIFGYLRISARFPLTYPVSPNLNTPAGLIVALLTLQDDPDD